MTKFVARCGECLGLKQRRLLNKDMVCSEQGKTINSRACAAFEFDTFAVLAPPAGKLGTRERPVSNIDSTLADLAGVIRSLPNDKLRLMASLILGEKITRNCGFFFWQKLYIRYRGSVGDNYMSNFCVARVLRATHSADEPPTLYLTSTNGSMQFTLVDYPNASCVFTAKEYRRLKQKMLGKVDPAIVRNQQKVEREIARGKVERRKKGDADRGFVLDIEAAFTSGNIEEPALARVKSSTRLTDIVTQMQNGFILTPSRTTASAAPVPEEEIYYQNFDGLSFDTRAVKAPKE